MRYAAIAVALYLYSIGAIAVSEQIDMRLGCKSNPKVIAMCFDLRGRLSAYNGNPTLRIWPIGTHRLVGVVDNEEKLSVPTNIRPLNGFSNDIFARYLVCPFTRFKPG